MLLHAPSSACSEGIVYTCQDEIMGLFWETMFSYTGVILRTCTWRRGSFLLPVWSFIFFLPFCTPARLGRSRPLWNQRHRRVRELFEQSFCRFNVTASFSGYFMSAQRLLASSKEHLPLSSSSSTVGRILTTHCFDKHIWLAVFLCRDRCHIVFLCHLVWPSFCIIIEILLQLIVFVIFSIFFFFGQF